ncbi:MAG: hypothetical protein O6499_02790 [Candidatus Dadabacteria bacterium]|nr:hypothetical protein [Candidatus Dadabacteria bacterium]
MQRWNRWVEAGLVSHPVCGIVEGRGSRLGGGGRGAAPRLGREAGG